jgi:8-oxo-dGTP pyrophosphatase MutT (NUDIX family)
MAKFLDAWKILKSEIVFDSKWFRLRKDHVLTPGGREFDDYFYADLPNFVNIVALFDNGDILVERQYKHAARKVSLETVAGVIDAGERPEETAARELTEETGFIADKMEFLGKVYENPTRTTSATYLFLATGLHENVKQHIDYNESDIALDRMPFTEFLQRIQSGEVFCEPAITAAFFACMKLGLLSQFVPGVAKNSGFPRLPRLQGLGRFFSRK